jgi:hypothetical protein
MRKDNAMVEKYRIKNGAYGSDESYGNNGAFRIPYRGYFLNVIVSDQSGWDHISVSVLGKNRCPTWMEMKFIKDKFFHEEETALQYHPSKDKYINDHNHVLHIWRPQSASIPMPPNTMV